MSRSITLARFKANHGPAQLALIRGASRFSDGKTDTSDVSTPNADLPSRSPMKKFKYTHVGTNDGVSSIILSARAF